MYLGAASSFRAVLHVLNTLAQKKSQEHSDLSSLASALRGSEHYRGLSQGQGESPRQWQRIRNEPWGEF